MRQILCTSDSHHCSPLRLEPHAFCPSAMPSSRWQADHHMGQSGCRLAQCRGWHSPSHRRSALACSERTICGTCQQSGIFPIRAIPSSSDATICSRASTPNYRQVKSPPFLTPQAISGLGGIGKTQMAVEYAYRYHQEYEVVLWARAENQETLISSYNTMATLLNLPERAAAEQEITIEAVKRWLQTHRKWLLILDNADDLALIPPFLPPVLGGTSCSSQHERRPWDARTTHRGRDPSISNKEPSSCCDVPRSLRLTQIFGRLPWKIDN